MSATRHALRKQGIVLDYLASCRPELNVIQFSLGVVKHHELPEQVYRTPPASSDTLDHAFVAGEARPTSNRSRELCPRAQRRIR